MSKTEFLGEENKRFSKIIMDLLIKEKLITTEELVTGFTIEGNSEKVDVYLNKVRAD